MNNPILRDLAKRLDEEIAAHGLTHVTTSLGWAWLNAYQALVYLTAEGGDDVTIAKGLEHLRESVELVVWAEEKVRRQSL